MIQLNEGHLGSYAKRKHIEPIIDELKRRGWAVEYSSGDCYWHFESEEHFNDFDIAFEQLCKRDEERPFKWFICFRATVAHKDKGWFV